MTTKPPVSEWISFNDAVAIVYRVTVCPRGEDEPALVAALADGSINAQRKLWQLDVGPHISDCTALHPRFWTDDWRDKLEEDEPEGYVAEVEVNHGDLRDWLDGPQSTSKTVKRGPPFKWDWDAFWIEATLRADQDRLPDTQAEFVEIMTQWFVDTVGGAPADSEIRKRTGPLYRQRNSDN